MNQGDYEVILLGDAETDSGPPPAPPAPPAPRAPSFSPSPGPDDYDVVDEPDSGSSDTWHDLLENDGGRIAVSVRIVDGVVEMRATHHEHEEIERRTGWTKEIRARERIVRTSLIGARDILRDLWSIKVEVREDPVSIAIREACRLEEKRRGEARGVNRSTPVVDDARLRPYQQVGAGILLASDGMLLGDEMGLGKTVETLVAIEKRRDANRILLVVPGSVQLTWERSTKEWAPSVENVRAAKSARDARRWLDRFTEGRRMLIVTWGLLPRLVGDLLQGWDLLVTDEQHQAKGYRTQRAQALFSVAWRCRARWLLTGTPVLNRADELFSILHLLDPVRWSSPSRLDDVVGIPAKRAALEPWMLRRLKKDVLTELPEVLEERWTVAPTRRSPVDIEQVLDELDDESTESQGRIHLAAVRRWMAEEKGRIAGERIAELVEGDESVVVFFTHEVTRAAIVKDLAERGIAWTQITGATSRKDRKRAEDDFQEGRVSVILGSEAMRDGVTLTRARVSLHVERWWTPEGEKQAKGRIDRFGQTREVLHIVMHLDESLDDWMDRLTRGKAKTIRALIDGDGSEP